MTSPVDPAAAPLVEPRPSLLRRLVIAFGALTALVALGVGGLLAWGLYQIEQVEEFDVDLAEPEPGEALNYLLVGSDSRASIDADDPDAGVFLGAEAVGMRSDTMLVARIDTEAETIDLVSVPRDLWVRLAPPTAPGQLEGDQRINVAYAAGAPQRLIDTVESSLGIEINHYIEVDFRGFESVIDTIGGVPMFFETPLEDPGSGLSIDQPGCRVLDGNQSLAFVRARSLRIRTADGWTVDGTGDLGRISRQQLFLQRALDQAAMLDLTDAVTLTRLVGQGSDVLSWDDSLDARSLLDVLRRFADLGEGAVMTHSLPVAPFRTVGGAEVLSLDVVAADDELDVFRGITPPTPTSAPAPATLPPPDIATVELAVLNGSGITGQAGSISADLEATGFSVVRIGDWPNQSLARTEIRFAPGRLADADLVARHLDPGADLIDDPSVGSEIVVITGTDLVSVLNQPRPGDPEALARLDRSVEDGAPEIGADAAADETTVSGPEAGVGYIPTGSFCTPE